MPGPKQVCLITLLFAGSGISLGLFYNVTFFGQAALPLPEPTCLLAPLLYYLAEANHGTPWYQAISWLAAFSLAGWIWLSSLALMARRFAPDVTREGLWRGTWAHGLFLLPVPPLLLAHAHEPDQGFTWGRLTEAVLVRKGLYWTTSGWETALNLIYFVLSGMVTFWMLRQAFLTTPKLAILKVVGLAALCSLLGVVLLASGWAWAG